MSTELCIYHKGCADGFGAAWVIKEFFKYGLGISDGEFYAAAYQTPPPDCTGKNVYIVDFSYKRPEMDAIIEVCESLVILDHHKTAEEELKGIFLHPKVSGMFDMNYSGAMLAWDYYHGNIEPPKLIKHIQDRDLWKFDIPGTREIITALYSHPQDFKVWDKFMGNVGCESLYAEGVALLRQHDKNVESLIKSCAREFYFEGHKVLFANLPYMFASDAGNIMSEGRPFSVTYYDSKDGRVFSLRSQKDVGLDVSEIAVKHGGGGHKNAAGFKLGPDDILNAEEL